MLGIVENIELGALQGPAEIYVGVLAATILFIATNAGIIGVSRLTYSMGQHRQLPEVVRTLHPRFHTPYVAIVVFGLVACVTLLPGQEEFLHGIARVAALLLGQAEQRLAVLDRHRRQRHGGQSGVHRDHGDLDPEHGPRDRSSVVAGLLRHASIHARSGSAPWRGWTRRWRSCTRSRVPREREEVPGAGR